jgi:hypothetical protein
LTENNKLIPLNKILTIPIINDNMIFEINKIEGYYKGYFWNLIAEILRERFWKLSEFFIMRAGNE